MILLLCKMEEPRDETDTRKPRRCYLITYSQDDLQKFPTKQSFADAVIEAFTSERSQSSPRHWACCIERHQLQGFHYHLALKLSASKRWLGCKRALERKHGIVVHFYDHEGYYSAYKYVCKFDQGVFHSENHPNLSRRRQAFVRRHIVKSGLDYQVPIPLLKHANNRKMIEYGSIRIY